MGVIRVLVGVIRRPGREAGTQAREGERAGHFGADGDGEVAFPARDSGFPAGMTEGNGDVAFPALESGFPAGMTAGVPVAPFSA